MADFDPERGEEEEEIPDEPPSPLAVARRALILSAVVCRANLEWYKDEDYRKEAVDSIREWFDDLDLWPHLEPDEAAILRAPLGKLERSMAVHGTWWVEGLAILSWALHCADFPPHDEKVNPIDVTNGLEFLAPEAAELLAAPTLRSAAELQACREWFYDAHCTLGGFLRHGGDGHLATWIVDYLRALAIDPQTVMVNGLLAYKGSALAEADRKQVQEWENLICERHRASIWLVGEYPEYTELPVDL
jgi:hypothetical protein